MFGFPSTRNGKRWIAYIITKSITHRELRFYGLQPVMKAKSISLSDIVALWESHIACFEHQRAGCVVTFEVCVYS